MLTDKIAVFLQHLVPQHLLTQFAGFLAECKTPWLKDFFIKTFIRKYGVDLNIATLNQVSDYVDFNSFFTRHLKPDLRPIISDSAIITSPADSCISQMGAIRDDLLIQAKGFHFGLKDLLGGDQVEAQHFINGNYATFYLAPKDYHRVHMPLAGTLYKTIYIPGKLFSVNQHTANSVSQLFARNERLVCLFQTDIGPVAVILVGAMLVGGINTNWQKKIRGSSIQTQSFSNGISLNKGDEMGFFSMGSTVILLFPENTMQWEAGLTENISVTMGSSIGHKIKL